MLSALVLTVALEQVPPTAPAALDPIYSGCPQAPTAARLLPSGEVLMSVERARRMACAFETCEAHRKDLQVQLNAEPAPWWPWAVVGGTAAGLAVGLAVGAFWHPWFKTP